MALITATLPIDFDNADFNRFLLGFLNEAFLNDVSASISAGPTADLHELSFVENGTQYSALLGGLDLAFVGIASGSPTGFLESIYLAGLSTPGWSIQDIAIAADRIYQVALTPSPVDDFDLLREMLGGDDTALLSAGSDVMRTFGGDDFIRGAGGDDFIDGGMGIDTSAYSNLANDYQIIVGPASVEVTSRSGMDGTDTLVNVEKLQFRDFTLDTTWFSKAATVLPGQLADLTDMYVAYFDRAPDAVGLFYWASRLSDGMTLPEIARSFFDQPETLAAYPAAQSNSEFVTKVYNNMLGRVPDSPGLAYWVDELSTGGVSRDEFMLAVIYGARASTGSPADVQYLANKNEVGRDFAVTEGLNNHAWAQAVMEGVDSSAASVEAARALIDGYATAATSPESSELVVHLVGIGN